MLALHAATLPLVLALLSLLLPRVGSVDAQAAASSSTPFLLAQATPAPAADADFVQGDFWALIIGINDYASLPAQKQLKAARPGAEAVARILRQYGVERERIVALYDRNAGRAAILGQLQGTLRRDVGPHDSLLIYFAGHCQTEGQGKDVGWIPADGSDGNPASLLSTTELQAQLAQIPARHVFVVADSCLDEGALGASRILGTPTVQDVYKRKSRWMLSAGVPSPQADGADMSQFSQAFVGSLRDNQLAYLTPIHLMQEMAKRLSPEAIQKVKDGPMTGVGDDDGQFIFRLDGATPPTTSIQVPVLEDPKVARLTQHIEVAKGVNLPQGLKDQVLADLQGQLNTVQQSIGEQRRKQEEERTKRIEEWRRRTGR